MSKRQKKRRDKKGKDKRSGDKCGRANQHVGSRCYWDRKEDRIERKTRQG